MLAKDVLTGNQPGHYRQMLCVSTESLVLDALQCLMTVYVHVLVCAGPLVVTQPQPSVGESVDSSDEDLDDSRSALPATGAAGRSSAWR
jgi:hypothetical protein